MKKIAILCGLFFSTACLSHAVDNPFYNPSGGVSSWNDLTDIPAGFADNTDNTGASGSFAVDNATTAAINGDSDGNGSGGVALRINGSTKTLVENDGHLIHSGGPFTVSGGSVSFAGGDLNIDGGVFTFITSTNKVKISTGTLRIDGSNAGAGQASSIFITVNSTATSGAKRGIEMDMTVNPGGVHTGATFGWDMQIQSQGSNNISNQLSGISMITDHAGTGNLFTAENADFSILNSSHGNITTAAKNIVSKIDNQGGGSVTSPVGLDMTVINSGTGTMTNARGLKITFTESAGSMTNPYAIEVNDVSSIDSNGYALYLAGGRNYFGGNIGISTASPAAALDVNGDSIFRSTVTIGDGAGTVAGKVEIGGESDQHQLVVEGYSTQNFSIFRVQNDADSALFVVQNDGDVEALSRFETAVGFDGIGAVDLDYGSADITDHTFITDGTGDGEIVLPNGSIGIAELAASGSPSASTFLRGDNTWAAPAGSGDVVANATQTLSGANTFSSTNTFQDHQYFSKDVVVTQEVRAASFTATGSGPGQFTSNTSSAVFGVSTDQDVFVLYAGSATIDNKEVMNAVDDYTSTATFTLTGTVNFNTASATGTLRVPYDDALPGTCSIGDTFWDQDADTNGSLYVCRAANTWKEVDDDGAGGGGGTGFLNLFHQQGKLYGDFITTEAEINNSTNVYRVLFDSATTEGIQWSFLMPLTYSSALTLELSYSMVSSTSGKVDMEADMMCVSDGDSQKVNVASFDSINEVSGGETVPGTTDYPGRITITMTNADSVAARDLCTLRLFRDHDDADDTCSSDLSLNGAMLEWTE